MWLLPVNISQLSFAFSFANCACFSLLFCSLCSCDFTPWNKRWIKLNKASPSWNGFKERKMNACIQSSILPATQVYTVVGHCAKSLVHKNSRLQALLSLYYRSDEWISNRSLAQELKCLDSSFRICRLAHIGFEVYGVNDAMKMHYLFLGIHHRQYCLEPNLGDFHSGR